MISGTNCSNQFLTVLKYLNSLHELCVRATEAAATAYHADKRTKSAGRTTKTNFPVFLRTLACTCFTSHSLQTSAVHPLTQVKAGKNTLFHGTFEISRQTGFVHRHKQKTSETFSSQCASCNFWLRIQACRPEWNASLFHSDTLIREFIWSHQISATRGLPLLPLMTSTAPAFHQQKKELFGLVCVSDIIANKWKLFYHTP